MNTISSENFNQDVDAPVKDKIRTCLDRNFLVQAVPGSGKTYNLVQRMIALILNGTPAHGIAAITFTRKAAEELRSRLRETIESRIGEAPALQQALLEQGLIDIEDGYVGTIHGFCARILREYPVEAKLDPSFIEIEEADEKHFFNKTWQEILTAYPEFLKPFADHDVDPEESTIINGLQRFCQFPDIDFSTIVKVETPDAIPFLNAVSTGWQNAVDFDPRPHLSEGELNEKADQIKAWRTFEALHNRLQKYYGKKNINNDELKEIRRAIRYLGKMKLANPEDENAKEALKAVNQQVDEACSKFRESYSYWLFPQLLPLLDKIREKEQEWRNQRGYVSYLDLLSRTVQLLKDAPHIRKSLQQKFPVLMIDEFQDTDPLQAEMAFLLSAEDCNENNWLKTRPRPGSLFLVGDPKQSIYRFRRADIKIYLQAAEHLAKTGGEILTLQQNRRSRAGLCNWVNQAFAPVFADQQATGQAPFDEMMPLRENVETAPVMALPIPASFRSNATKQMGDYDSEKFAAIIAEMLAQPEPAISDGRKLQPDDFMILCRKNDELVKYALCIENRGIGVNLSGGGQSLAKTLEKDFKPLYWLLRALSDGNDAAVIYAVLVGPIFGCSDEQIYEHLQNGGRLSCTQPAQGKTPVSMALGKLFLFRSWMQELVPGAAFRRIVSALKYDAFVLLSDYGLLKTSFLGNVARLFDDQLFSQATDVLGTWVQSWPVDRSIDEPGKVKLLTMHKAKGLEAPVVMLGMTSQPRYGPGNVIIGKEADGDESRFKGLLRLAYGFGENQSHEFAVSPEWNLFTPAEKDAAIAEKLRLDYVACTRARDLLIISRHQNKKGDATTPLFKQLSAATNQCPEIEIAGVQVAGSDKNGNTDFAALAEWRTSRKSWRKSKKVQNFGEESVTSLTEKAEKKFSQRSGGGRALGVAVHGLLCNLMRWKVKNVDDPHFLLLVDRELEDDAELKPRRAVIIELLSNVLQSSLWAEAGKSPEIHTEVPFMDMVSASDKLPYLAEQAQRPVFVNGVVDLIYRLPKGWKIVDYKTNLIDSEAHRLELGEFYRGQLELYASCWQKITGEEVCEKSLLFVRDGHEFCLD